MDLNSLQILLASASYREFLGINFRLQKERNPKFSFTVFAKKAGFQSRTFPREVMAGSRRITHNSLPGFIKGMGISGDLAEYFDLLVLLVEVDMRGDRDTTQNIRKRLATLKARLLSRHAHVATAQGVDRKSFSTEKWPIVYAALGSPEIGATVEQIENRTGFINKDVTSILKKMLEHNFVEFDQASKRYKAFSSHHVVAALSDSAAFKSFFIYALEHMRTRALYQFNDPNSLYFTSSVSVTSENLAKIHQHLHKILTQFVDHIEDPEGDRVINLVVGSNFSGELNKPKSPKST